MSRKLLLLVGLPVVAALTAAGVALAAVSSGAHTASATFAATTVSKSKLVTCSVNGGDTFASTLATYTGTASSSDARLDGALTIRAQSVVDTSTGLGRVTGAFKIVNASGDVAKGSVDAAVDNGQASGLATAQLTDPAGRLVATLSAPFDPGTGFGSGSLGTGSVNGDGVVLSGACHAGHVHSLRWLVRHLVHRLRHRH